jgi:hypothetical protein
MKKFLLLLFIGFSVFSVNKSVAQTNGTLTFSVLSTCPSGQFANRHIVAIWIQNSSTSNASTTFIKTKIKYGNNYLQYLNAWKTASTSNVTDATTGATKTTASETLTFTWNGTNSSSALVPDGTYYVWMQSSSADANGATSYIAFTKGPTAFHQTGGSGNFTNIVLDWTPAVTGISEATSGDLSVKCFPNPFTTETTIDYTLENSAKVFINVYDLHGSLVKSLANDVESYGKNSVKWTASSEIASGVYYISVKAGNFNIVKKVLLSR